MEAQDVDSSVTATLTCSMKDMSETLNVTWFNENGTISYKSGGYLAEKGNFKLYHTRYYRKFNIILLASGENSEICDLFCDSFGF